MNRIRQSALYIYLNTFLEYLCFPWIIPLTANSIGQIVVWGGENPTSSNIWNFLCILQSLNMVLLVTWSRSFVIIVFLQDNWIYVSSEYIWILRHENGIFCLKRFVENHWKVAMYLEVFHSISLSKKGETYLILRQVRNRKYLLIGQILFTAVCFSSHISKAVIKFGRQLGDCLPGELFHCFIFQEFFWVFGEMSGPLNSFLLFSVFFLCVRIISISSWHVLEVKANWS